MKKYGWMLSFIGKNISLLSVKLLKGPRKGVDISMGAM